jgi:uncharacterized membrane protein YkvA (DUF1232 family)
MFDFLIICVLVWAVCWGIKQGLGYLERQQTMQRLERMAKDAGETVDPIELEEVARQICGTKERAAGGLSTGMKCLIAIGAIIYIVCPLDFDFIPVLGWVDDAAVGYYAYKAITGK